LMALSTSRLLETGSSSKSRRSRLVNWSIKGFQELAFQPFSPVLVHCPLSVGSLHMSSAKFCVFRE
jgi:hypothetical protein